MKKKEKIKTIRQLANNPHPRLARIFVLLPTLTDQNFIWIEGFVAFFMSPLNKIFHCVIERDATTMNFV
jgi:hypothetical protein